MKFIQAQVLMRSHGTDIIMLSTDLPPPFPPNVSKQNAVLELQVEAGKGANYVRENFELEPEIINMS